MLCIFKEASVRKCENGLKAAASACSAFSRKQAFANVKMV